MKVKNSLRIPIGFAAGIIFLLGADPSVPSLLLGLTFMVIGESIRFVSAGTLIKYEGVTRNGIYAYTRNPLYIGSYIIGLGACIAGRDPLFAVFFLIAFPVLYMRLIKREEKYLRLRYGEEYERYTREVPRFWSIRIDLREVLRESSPFLAVKNMEILTVLGILAVNAVMIVKLLR